MAETRATLPGFKPIFTVIGSVYALLAVSTLLQGPTRLLAQFGVPDQVLSQPHFLDFFHFLFVHMTVLGILIILLGQLVEGARKQRIAARVLLLVQLHYLYLDIRTSTWGNGLYASDRSLVPVFIGLAVVACFLYLAARPLRIE